MFFWGGNLAVFVAVFGFSRGVFSGLGLGWYVCWQ
jgi:hypothetical protein